MEKGRGESWATAAKLPDSQYEALWLRYGQDMSVKEIAAAMGRSQVCIKVLLYRARASLARQLNEHAFGEDLRL
jgi:RNA polymerase sigma-70 factor (ECF subfamily)